MNDSRKPDLTPVNEETLLFNLAELLPQIAGRYASLFMICYQRKDVSGIHITLTALTHAIHALGLWEHKEKIQALTNKYILVGGFPKEEYPALVWLLNHYFDVPNDTGEDALLGWYQSLDDEWVLRKKLRKMFPEKTNSELTMLIAAEKDLENKTEGQVNE